MNLNFLKDENKYSLLQLLQKYEEMLDGTVGKYTGSNHTWEIKEELQSLIMPNVFLYQKFISLTFNIYYLN